MTQIDPDVRFHEVMQRTMFNLQFVKAHADKAGPFEVVQLMNSFTGAMVHPWEAISKANSQKFRGISITEARNRDWPVVEKEFENDVDPSSYRELLQWMRNGIAHGNLEFEGESGSITRVRIWNERNGRRHWGAILNVQDMEDFLWLFYDLALGELPRPRSEHLEGLAYAAD